MARIRIIGLAGRSKDDDWSSLLDGHLIVLRSARLSTRVLPDAIVPSVTFDHVLDSLPSDTAVSELVETVSRLSRDNAVAFLVPGVATCGDIIVEAIAALHPIDVVPGVLDAGLVARSSPYVIDALALAIAEQAWPFQAGQVGIDPIIPLIVTNWHGSSVMDLVSRYLLRQRPTARLAATEASFVFVDGVDPLNGARSFAALEHIVARLRMPDGCPWDREQSAGSMMSDLREEVEELQQAIDAGDWDNVAEELGDILLHVVMQAQIAAEASTFTIEDVLGSVTSKLVRRHPHVFGDERAASPDEVKSLWQRVKREEKAVRSDFDTQRHQTGSS